MPKSCGPPHSHVLIAIIHLDISLSSLLPLLRALTYDDSSVIVHLVFARLEGLSFGQRVFVFVRIAVYFLIRVFVFICECSLGFIEFILHV
jgi:hypothetical protein